MKMKVKQKKNLKNFWAF